jgi:hypothetical protein
MVHDVTHARALDGLIKTVGNVRPTLIDAWETTALIESLGYTDARVRREFGFSDAAALGAHIFEALASRLGSREASSTAPERGASAALLDAIAISLVYALPWLVIVCIEHGVRDSLRVPASARPPLSLALMFSLIVSGGFVQAIARRGQFYIALKQPRLAAHVCAYLLRLAAIVSLGFAIAGVLVAWRFKSLSWPYLVLWADEFLVLGGLWLLSGVLALRNEQWRVPLAYAAGVLAFVAVRAIGYDSLLALLAASGATVGAAALQVRRVFVYTGLEDPPRAAPLPRMTVVLYRMLPFVFYGTMYFGFLFLNRIAASGSIAAFAIAPPYKLGLDLALLTFLFGSAGVEYGNMRFATLLARAVREPFEPDDGRFARRQRRGHLRALGIVIASFAVIAALVSLIARRLIAGEIDAAWTTLAVSDAGYLLFAIGALNAMVLFRLNRPWSALYALAAGLIVDLAMYSVFGRTANPDFAAAGLAAGAFVIAVQTTVAVRRAIRAGAHAISATT